MPIFTQQLRCIDYANSRESLKQMANHIRYIQEQLEYTLMNLDSSNVTEIAADVTNITSSTGNMHFTGNSITLKGTNGEMFEVGVGGNGVFQFQLNGENGEQVFYLSREGQFVLTSKADVVIDGGEW